MRIVAFNHLGSGHLLWADRGKPLGHVTLCGLRWPGNLGEIDIREPFAVGVQTPDGHLHLCGRCENALVGKNK